MREEGFVKSTFGNSAEVVIRRKTACGDNCASCGGACKKSFQTVTAKNLCGAKSGDFVAVEMDSKKVYLSAFFVYILPLIVFVTAFFVGERYLKNSMNAVVSVALSVLSFVPAFIMDRVKKDDFVHTVVEIFENT